MRKKRLLVILSICVMALFTGCKDKSLETAAKRDEGIALMEAGDYEGAIACFDDALGMSLGKVGPLEIDVCYYKAAAQYNAGLFNEATTTYTALINYDKGNFEPYFMRGCIYANEGEVNLAIADYNAAIEIDPKNYMVYIQAYENFTELGYVFEAEQFLNSALVVEDKSAEGMYYKGRIYYLLGQYDSAIAQLEDAVEKNIVDAKLYLAKTYKAIGDDYQAQVLLEEYAKSDEVNSTALGELGDIECAVGNYDVAYSYYEAGLAMDEIDNKGQLLQGKVVALEHMGRFDEAREVLTQYIELYPSDSQALLELEFLKTR